MRFQELAIRLPDTRHLYFASLNKHCSYCPAGATFSERSLSKSLVPKNLFRPVSGELLNLG